MYNHDENGDPAMDRLQQVESLFESLALKPLAPWAAVQDLIGALQSSRADVVRFDLGGRYFLVFALATTNRVQQDRPTHDPPPSDLSPIARASYRGSVSVET